MIGINAGSRLDRLPLSAFHRRILWLVGLGLFFDSGDITIQTTVLGALLHSGWSTIAQNGYFISATFAGLAVGAAVASAVGERLGRRFMYQFNLAVFGIASIAAAFAPTMEWLIALRFVAGLGMGAELVVGYTVLAEFMPPQSRGRTLLYAAMASVVANPIAAVLGLVVIPTIGWRWMFVAVGVGALCVWFARRSLPESPRWLESAGRYEEGERILAAIEAEVGNGRTLPVPAPATAAPPERQPVGILFSRPVIGRTVTAMAINIAFACGGYGFLQWIPTFLVKQGVGLTTSLAFNFLIQLGTVVGPAIGILLADRIGRKPLLIGASLAAAVFGLIYPFARMGPEIVLCGFMLTVGLYLMLGVGVAVYLPELFPTQYRMLGTGVAQMTGRLTTIGVPFAVVAIFSAFGAGGVALSVAGVLIVVAIVIATLGIETNGAPLERLGPDDSVSQPLVHHANPA